MANEAVLFIRTDHPIPFTVANGTGIEKGAVLKLTDPLTAAAADGAADMVAGIAASGKIASDGKTKLGVYQRGIFKMTLSGVCAVGDALRTDLSDNHVSVLSSDISGVRIIGTSLETGATGDT